MIDKIFYSICFGFIFIILFSNFYIKDPPIFFEQAVSVGVLASVGQIVDEPDTRERNQRLVVRVSSGDAETKILVTTDLDQNFQYGNWVSLSGDLEKPQNFITDTGKEFDYINYLKKDGIYYLMSYPEISIFETEKNQGNFLKRNLIFVKQKFLDTLNYAILPPNSLFMGGLILGERANFSQEQRQQFIDTGTIHIIALSGYNITIVAEWIMKVFMFLPQILAIYIGIFSVFLFVLMTGGASTAVRAGIMACLALLARATGRNYDIGRALLLAGVIMIAYNPMILRYDVSFQLSFMATVAVIYLAPKFEKYFYWVTQRFGLRDMLTVTTAVYVFVLPFILYKMGNLSVVALPANFLVLPFIPVTMGLGFLTVFVGVISPHLSLIVGHIASIFLRYELAIIDFFANFSFASIAIADFPLWLTIAIYACFIYKLFGRDIYGFFKKSPDFTW